MNPSGKAAKAAWGPWCPILSEGEGLIRLQYQSAGNSQTKMGAAVFWVVSGRKPVRRLVRDAPQTATWQ